MLRDVAKNTTETFLLVHGSWHGGWCWRNVEELLRQKGYRTIAPDLPGHGEDRDNPTEQTLETYAKAITDILDAEKEPVILVGHSMAGSVITLAASRRPAKVKKLVYLSAFLLMPGQSCHALDGSGVQPFDLSVNSPDGKTWLWSKESVINRYASACKPEDQEFILKHLCREFIAPLVTKMEYDFPAWDQIRRFYITCSEDVAFTPELTDKMFKLLPCEKVYGIQADHSAYFSAPDALADTLQKIAQEP